MQLYNTKCFLILKDSNSNQLEKANKILFGFSLFRYAYKIGGYKIEDFAENMHNALIQIGILFIKI